MSEFLSREALLAKTPRRYDVVALPIRGGKVRIQSLTERERAKFERDNQGKDGKTSGKSLETVRRRLMILAVVDGQGNRLLLDEDLPVLAEWDSADVNAVCDAVSAHCGFTDEDLESIAKNSEATAADASPSN